MNDCIVYWRGRGCGGRTRTEYYASGNVMQKRGEILLVDFKSLSFSSGIRRPTTAIVENRPYNIKRSLFVT